jgi:HK97 family phage major capsid protein
MRRHEVEAAQKFINDGKSADDFRQYLLDKMEAPAHIFADNANAAAIGMSDKDVRAYSFLRVLNYLANPQSASARNAAGFELECAAAAAAKAPQSPKGLLVPHDVLRAPVAFGQRDLQATASGSGAKMVATNLLMGSFIDLLRNKQVLAGAGMTVLNGLSGNVAIPRQTAAGTVYWVGESVDSTEADQTLDQVTLSPKIASAWTNYSKQLLQQTSLDVEAFVRNDLTTILALELDRAGLYGDPSGASGQPTGLTLQTNILKTAFAAAQPTFAEIVDMETQVAVNNADIASQRYLLNPKMRGQLKTALKFNLALTGTDTAGAIAVSGAQGPTIWEPGNTLNGYDTVVSNQVSATSSTKNHLFFGAWSQLLQGLWGGLDLVVDPYTQAQKATVRVIAHQMLDYAVRQPKAFAFNHQA